MDNVRTSVGLVHEPRQGEVEIAYVASTSTWYYIKSDVSLADVYMTLSNSCDPMIDYNMQSLPPEAKTYVHKLQQCITLSIACLINQVYDEDFIWDKAEEDARRVQSLQMSLKAAAEVIAMLTKHRRYIA